MLPWGHLGVGYLVYTFGTHVVDRRAPTGEAVVTLAFATQLPDLIDKPLNWWFSVFDGRAIGHSVLTAIVLTAVVVYIANRYDRPYLIAAFSIGVFTHLLGDSFGALLSGEWNQASFLLWPLVPAPTYPSDSLFDHLLRWRIHLRAAGSISPGAFVRSRFWQQFLAIPVLFAVWAVDGFPGVRTIWNVVRL